MLKSFRIPVVIVGLVVLMFAAAQSLEAAPPVNDACSAATSAATMPPAFSDYISDTMEATGEASPSASCNVDPTFKNQHSVWYVWTAPDANQVEVNTYGSNYDTVVAVWSGACGSLVEAACNDDAHFSYQSKVIFTPVAGTTYYIEVMGYDDLEFGSLVVNVQAAGGVGVCEQSSDPQLISSSTNEQSESSINAAGEAVWVEFNPSNNYDQIMSNKRGALVTDAAFHYSPSINGIGDVVWSQMVSGFEQIKKRSNSGTVADVTTGSVNHSDPAINDNGEVVWVQFDSVSGFDQIFSSTRGLLTSSAAWHYSPAINNNGEVCWSQYDPATLETQVACLGGGMITSGVNEHYSPSINNAGTIVWSEVDAATGNTFIGSISGNVTDICPNGKHYDPTINNCGNVVFTNKFASGSQQVYLKGDGVSCLPNVTGVSPASVPEGTATNVTLTGTGFSGATAVKLSNGTALTSVVVNSDTSITATVPATVVSGSYDVRVTAPNGTNQTSTAKVVVEVACNPDVDMVTSVTSNVSLVSAPGVPITSANVCDKIQIAATVGGGCKSICSFQVRRKATNNISSQIDPYWMMLGGQNMFTKEKTVLWDTSGMGPGNYTVRVYCRNEEGIGSYSTNEKGGELTFALPGNSTNKAFVVTDTGCTDQPATPPKTCNPDTNMVTQVLTSVTIDGLPVTTAKKGQSVKISADLGGSGCEPLCSFQVRRKAADNPGNYDPYWIILGDENMFTRATSVVWDTDNNGAGNYTVRVYCRNKEGIGSYATNEKGGVINFGGTTLFPLIDSAVCFADLNAVPEVRQIINWNESYTPVSLTASTLNCGNVSTFNFEISSAGANSWSQISGCEQPNQGANQICSWNAGVYGEGDWDLRVTANNGTNNPVAVIPAYDLTRKVPVVNLNSSVASPMAKPYQNVTLTAQSWYFSNAQYYFEYKKTGVATYTMLCNWSTSKTCTWPASGLTSGTYDIKVYASDHVPTQEAVSSISFTLSP